MQSGLKESQELRRERYRGTVDGIGYSFGWKGKMEQILTLRDIVAEQDGRTVVAHTTFRVGKNLMTQGILGAGDVIAFDATWTKREDDEHSCCVTSWYTLTRPSKVVRVSETPMEGVGKKH